MSFFNTQNPGIGGLDEVTQAEGEFLADLAGLSFSQGDVLYYDGSSLNRLAAGTSGHFLKTNGTGANPEWAAVAAGSLTVTEADGSPSVSATTLKFPNGTVTDNEDGSVTLTLSGSGDVTGPASSTDNAVARFDSTTGKVLQNSGVTINDANGISSTVADTGNTVVLTLVQNDVTNNPRVVSITNAGTATSLFIDANGNTSTSTSTGGAVLLENTGNSGAGMVIYSNHATATGRLLVVRADNTGFATQPVYIENDGSSHAVSIVHNSTGANALGLSIVSTNPNDTTLGISGQETGKGTLKITHTGTGTDTNASAISISLAGTGTASQGIFIDTVAGTSGKLLNIRDQGTEQLVTTSTATTIRSLLLTNDLPVTEGGTGASTAADALINLGLTATAAELNILDGATLTVTELNYVDGVTSAIQTQLDGKQTQDAFLDDITDLTDPGADRILFWDDSAGVVTWLTVGSGLTITGTTITASAGSGISRTIVVTSESITLGSTSATDYVYLVSGAHTLTLPTAVSNTNRYTIKNNHSAAITINTTSSQTIDGSTSIEIAPEDSIDLISDDSNWFVI